MFFAGAKLEGEGIPTMGDAKEHLETLKLCSNLFSPHFFRLADSRNVARFSTVRFFKSAGEEY